VDVVSGFGLVISASVILLDKPYNKECLDKSGNYFFAQGNLALVKLFNFPSCDRHLIHRGSKCMVGNEGTTSVGIDFEFKGQLRGWRTILLTDLLK
jgi:hypothetical protein